MPSAVPLNGTGGTAADVCYCLGAEMLSASVESAKEFSVESIVTWLQLKVSKNFSNDAVEA